MPLQLWVREADTPIARKLSGAKFDNYCRYPLDFRQFGPIATGVLENNGLLSAFHKDFVLARQRMWRVEDTDEGLPFATIKNRASYPEGLVLTPYSEIDVKFHLKTKTITQSSGIQRVELLGSDDDDFVERVFATYYGDRTIIQRDSPKDKRLLLYSSARDFRRAGDG